MQWSPWDPSSQKTVIQNDELSQICFSSFWSCLQKSGGYFVGADWFAGFHYCLCLIFASLSLEQYHFTKYSALKIKSVMLTKWLAEVWEIRVRRNGRHTLLNLSWAIQSIVSKKAASAFTPFPECMPFYRWCPPFFHPDFFL